MENRKKLIEAARSAYPDSLIVQSLCDALAIALNNNEANFVIKQNMASENKRLQATIDSMHETLNAVIEAAGEDWQDVDNLPNVIRAMADLAKHRQAPPVSQQQQLLEQMITGLHKLSNPQNPTIPPMSPDCFRQHAAIAALNGVLAMPNKTTTSAQKLAKDAVMTADFLVQELAQRVQNNDLRAKVRADHAEWAAKTFGNTGPLGPLKHLSAEALETAAAPDDLSEWADMQFLFWDAQRKAGVTDEQITQAMIAKLEVNKARQWPESKEGEPRFHIKDGD